jgi:H+-translocating NAD(P) transhydrogenase subunit alpha
LLLGILKELAPGESRVALLPESLKTLLAQGITVTVESGAGIAAGATDQAYIEAGATVTADRASILANADLVPIVNALRAADQISLKPLAVMIGFLKPLDAPRALSPAIDRLVTLFSMELIPRISRGHRRR